LPFGLLPGSPALGVGNDPNAVALVWGVDGDSWNNKRLDFVTFAFQVSVNLLEYHASVRSNEAANIFTDNPPRMKFAYDAKHFWPEIAVVLRAAPSTDS
jgi:hypothetical protein